MAPLDSILFLTTARTALALSLSITVMRFGSRSEHHSPSGKGLVNSGASSEMRMRRTQCMWVNICATVGAGLRCSEFERALRKDAEQINQDGVVAVPRIESIVEQAMVRRVGHLALRSVDLRIVTNLETVGK